VSIRDYFQKYLKKKIIIIPNFWNQMWWPELVWELMLSLRRSIPFLHSLHWLQVCKVKVETVCKVRLLKGAIPLLLMVLVKRKFPNRCFCFSIRTWNQQEMCVALAFLGSSTPCSTSFANAFDSLNLECCGHHSWWENQFYVCCDLWPNWLK